MTKRERVLTALRHEQPDRCPHNIGLTYPAYEKLVAHFGKDKLDEALDNHLGFTHLSPPDAWQEVKAGYWQDEFGVIWDRTVDRDIGNVCNCMMPNPTLKGYRFPNPRDPRRTEHIPAHIERCKNRLVGCDIGFSLYERAWTLRGMENLLLDMIENPDFVDDLLDAICEHNLALIEQAVKFPIEAFQFGDDWGQQHGMIMGAPLWRRFLKPRLARMYGAAKRAGKFVFIHSCGDVREIFPELIEIGVDVFNPFQPEVMDVHWMKKTYGDRISFYGGLSLQHTLPYGTPEQVKAEVCDLIATVGHNGGYILSPCHSVTKDVPLENMLAMLEAIREQ